MNDAHKWWTRWWCATSSASPEFIICASTGRPRHRTNATLCSYSTRHHRPGGLARAQSRHSLYDGSLRSMQSTQHANRNWKANLHTSQHDTTEDTARQRRAQSQSLTSQHDTTEDTIRQPRAQSQSLHKPARYCRGPSLTPSAHASSTRPIPGSLLVPRHRHGHVAARRERHSTPVRGTWSVNKKACGVLGAGCRMIQCSLHQKMWATSTRRH